MISFSIIECISVRWLSISENAGHVFSVVTCVLTQYGDWGFCRSTLVVVPPVPRGSIPERLDLLIGTRPLFRELDRESQDQ